MSEKNEIPANIPAGYETISDYPLTRFRATWPSRKRYKLNMQIKAIEKLRRKSSEEK